MKLPLAFAKLTLGLLLGLALLEVTLRANPALLLRGMAAPAPVDAPVTVTEYDVRYSEADEIYWRPDLIRPILPADDLVEAHVRYVTDEFGFRNPPPLPPTVEVVVLGRSYSLGAQAAEPWPGRLAQATGWRVLNLSQAGSSLDVKRAYLQRFGLPRRPRWVVVEIVPALDVIGYQPASPLLTGYLPRPIIQYVWRQASGQAVVGPAAQPIYPLAIDLPGRRLPLTCCLHYLDFLLLDSAAIMRRPDWAEFTAGLADLARDAQARSACVAVLYLPMKPEIYFPLAEDPAQLEPALQGLDSGLPAGADPRSVIDSLRRNAGAGRDALAAYAAARHLVFIDPSQRLSQSVVHGDDPFMVYDSHLNALGHQIVAQAVAEALQPAPCP